MRTLKKKSGLKYPINIQIYGPDAQDPYFKSVSSKCWVSETCSLALNHGQYELGSHSRVRSIIFVRPDLHATFRACDLWSTSITKINSLVVLK